MKDSPALDGPHPPSAPPPATAPRRLHACTQEGCTYKTPQATTLKRHMLKHGEGEVYPCPAEGCHFTSGDKSNLRRHFKGWHEPKEEKRPVQGPKMAYPCKECTKVYLLPKGLERHVKEVHRRELYECKEVGCETESKFHTPAELDLHHKTTHWGMPLLVCECRKYSTVDPVLLRNHKKGQRHQRYEQVQVYLREERERREEAERKRQEVLREEALAGVGMGAIVSELHLNAYLHSRASPKAIAEHVRSCERQYIRFRLRCEGKI